MGRVKEVLLCSSHLLNSFDGLLFEDEVNVFPCGGEDGSC
jgi:hypothetical protein